MGSNNKRVGYFCSLVPREIMLAAGVQPQRVAGKSDTTSAADGYLYHNLCPYIKSVMATAADGGLQDLGGAVFARSCDGMRRMYDAWRSYINTGFTYMLEVPQNNNEIAINYYAGQLRDFAFEIGKAYGKKVTEKSLGDSIRATNGVRQQMRKLLFLQESSPLPLKGSTLFQMGIGLFEQDIKASADTIKDHYRKARESVAQEKGKGKLRVLISGNVMDRPDLFQMVEDAGADVPVADLCTDLRYFDRNVDEGVDDPYTALARAYLGKPHCAHTASPIARVEEIKETVKKYNIDGVLLTSVKFCDLHLYDAPFIIKNLAEAGVPVQFIENDYCFSSKSQLKVRVEAFVEVLDSARS
jgi:benzoyl-CoA reductase/2-hydroxyglutaryl-CoA dehydratase subunit BcrC/BadD/HgdB